MEHLFQKRWEHIVNQSLIWIIFILGLWLVVLKIFGPHWEFVIGDLGDGRFNNFILEHFYQWISGRENDYWNASYFYPFKYAVAFSDNLLGSAPFYAIFRWVGFDRETSFQWWYLLSFCFNYASASYVLSQLKFNTLATASGAFFFTFGLPILAQETHAQLFYRFAIPLACFFLVKFFQIPRLRTFIALILFLVWQFYLSIYLGVFLSLLLLTLGMLLPFSIPLIPPSERLVSWPKQLREAWLCSRFSERIITSISFLGLGILFVILMWPYYQASRHYGLFRSWAEISIPNWQNYLSADNAQIWMFIKNFFSYSPATVEQQLFPGIAVVSLVFVGILGRFRSKNSSLAWLHLGAVIILIFITLNFNDMSAYWFLWQLPGIRSIRAVGRIQLVLMWPIALFITWVIDELLQRAQQGMRWLNIISLLLLGLLITESAFFNHVTYSKLEAQQRLTRLMQKIPKELPKNPILFFADYKTEHYIFQEIDAMLITQELRLPTLNGYSGNFPPGYEAAANCIQIPKRITRYMKFENISRKAFYLDTIKRIVPIGFDDCNPDWWNQWPK